MLEYRVKERRTVGAEGKPEVAFYPEYRRSFDWLLGIGWWTSFPNFKGTHAIHGACRTLEEAEHYLEEQKVTEIVYHYPQSTTKTTK